MSRADPSHSTAPSAQAPERCLAVVHHTRYDYGSPVALAHHLAHLRPRAAAWQQVLDWQLVVDPLPEGEVSVSQDVYGNWRHGFAHLGPHAHLVVSARSRVALAPRPPLLPEASPAWDQVAAAWTCAAARQQAEAYEFTLGSRFSPCDARLRAYAEPLLQPGRPLLSLALALMAHVHADMAYQPLATDTATDALQALAQRRGVCQDFAHLMVAVWRSCGLAARYESGYVLNEPMAGSPAWLGGDASHAWLAVWCPHHGWVALDPTNNAIVGLDHVTVAWGRDYADVAPLRGVIRGGHAAPPQVAVTVTRG